MGFQSEQKEYYESQLQKKILYVPNLSIFMKELNEQVLKLPHEMQDPQSNIPVGTKYSDIVDSVVNGVEMLYSNFSPIRKMLNRNYEAPIDDAFTKKNKFLKSLDKLEWIYNLAEDADMLNDRVIVEEIPEDGAYIEGDVGEYVRDMSAPKPPADGKALGSLDKKDDKPLVEADLG